MKIEENYSLANHNTFNLPIKTRWFMEYESEEELSRILRDEYFQEQISLHIGSGSNLLFINDFNGVIFHSAIKGIETTNEDAESITLRIGAGHIWDDVVKYATENNYSGIENLSGIPGECGAAAIQNIGAYGSEIKDVIVSVETYNQLEFTPRVFSCEECEYGYRDSFFKKENTDPYIVTYINLKLSKKATPNLSYHHLREALSNIANPTATQIRAEVLKMRNSKLPDPKELGNAGSFFKNPIVSNEKFESLQKQYPEIPSFPAKEGFVKIPAGWLIEQCGFKGKRHGEVGVYEKQALVLVNFGEAQGHEIALVAESIRMAVNDKFGIELMPEVKYIG